MIVQSADADDKILKCWNVIHELRPHLKHEEFLNSMKAMQSEGVKMFYIEEDGMAVSAGVFRMNYYFARGKNIYIDDLSTLPAYRGKGYGSHILKAIKNYAVENNCDNIHLDSGHHRYDAHRLYLNFGFQISSHHFALKLN